MIPFNVPPYTGEEMEYVTKAIAENHKICGDGPFTKKCNAWLEERFGIQKALLTTSCTHALEICAFLMDLQPGDEVILPSYTFVSSANAFLIRGAVPVFVDIRPDTMNIDEKLIEAAITPKTKGICVVHYAGVSCEMDTIMDIAKRHHLMVVEDAAQGVMSTYKGKALGSLGDFAAYSFHETKNYSMGEGGAVLIRDAEHNTMAEILREKGTDRSRFYRGEVDKYTWINMGSSYLPSDINAAYIYPQLLRADDILENRMHAWDRYYKGLSPLAAKGVIDLPFVPQDCQHNAHMFYIKCADADERGSLIAALKAAGIGAVFHYIPLHSAEAGRRFARFHGEDRYTTRESERLLRLPMFYGLTDEQVDSVLDVVEAFYNARLRIHA